MDGGVRISLVSLVLFGGVLVGCGSSTAGVRSAQPSVETASPRSGDSVPEGKRPSVESVTNALAATDASNASSPLIAFVSDGASSGSFMQMVDLSVRDCMASAGFQYVARSVAEMTSVVADPNEAIIASLLGGDAVAYSAAMNVEAADSDGEMVKGGCLEVANRRMFVGNKFPKLLEAIDSFVNADERRKVSDAAQIDCRNAGRSTESCAADWMKSRAAITADAERRALESFGDEIQKWKSAWPKIQEAGK
jgi:hypothetical protein